MCTLIERQLPMMKRNLFFAGEGTEEKLLVSGCCDPILESRVDPAGIGQENLACGVPPYRVLRHKNADARFAPVGRLMRPGREVRR